MSRKYPTWLEKIFGVKAANKEETPAPEAIPEVNSEAVSDVVSESAPEVNSEPSQEEGVSHANESADRVE